MWKLLVCCAIMLAMPSAAFAAHPLLTDDAGTVGKGKFQLELNAEYSHDRDAGVRTNANVIASTLTFGLVENVDIVFSLPYHYIQIRDEESKATERGIGDSALDLKWRFFERDGWSLAVKPGITLPSGDKDKGLGAGRVTGRLFFITTKEVAPWTFHLNLGYIRNDNSIDERRDLWHVSVASEYELTKTLKIVANIGMERSADKASSTAPAFILGGLIYRVSELVDIDAGVRGGLSKPEPDISLLAGVTFHF